MNIFNSLGSNYDSHMVWRSILAPGSRRSTDNMKSKLADQYQGSVTLTYKGRQALQLALESSGLLKDSAVGINGFTCFEVYQSVKRAGYKPVMIDVAPHQLHFSLKELEKAHSQAKNLKAVIIQNTLGLPADMPELEEYAHKHKLLIVEDLAHSLGTKYSDGREAGTVGELTMLSFSQDKPVDVVAGGALIDRRKNSKEITQPKRRVSLWQRDINSLYPMWTALIRTTYPLGLGRYIHFGLKKLHLLATPMSDNVQGMYAMEPAAVRLLLNYWDNRNVTIGHRQLVAASYKKLLPENIQIKPVIKSKPSYLRFPIWVDDRTALIAHLKKVGVHVGDSWYDAPISSPRYMSRTDYKDGECPNAEDLAKHIVNLPTHRHVSEADAQKIAQEVNVWLKSQ